MPAASLADARQKLEAATRQNETLTQEAAAAKAALAAGDPQSAALRQQITALATQLAEQKGLGDQLAKANTDLTAAQSAASAAGQQNSQQVAAQKAEADRLAAANQDLASRLTALTAENQKLAANRTDPAAQDELTRQLATAQQAAADARTAARQALADKDKSAADLANLAAQSAAKDAQLVQVQNERDRLAAENQKLAANPGAPASADVARLKSDLANLAAQKDSLEKDLEVSKQTTAAALAAQAAAARTAPDFAAAAMERQTLQDQLHKLEAQTEDDRQTAAKEITALANQLSRTRDTNKALADANRALLESNSTVAADAVPKADADKLTSDLAAQRAANARLTQERDELRSQTAQLATRADDNDRMLAAFKTQLADATARLAESGKAVEAHSASVAELTGLNAKMTDANKSLQTQISDLQKQLEATRADTARLAQSTGETETARRQAAEAKAAADQTRAELETVKSKLDETSKAAEQHQASVAELTGLNAKMADDNKSLQTQVAAFSNQLDSLKADNTRLASAEAARQQAEQRAASLADAATQLVTTQQQVAALRSDNARLSDQAQALERDRATRLVENNALAARLRLAQGALDQIASATRLINSSANGLSDSTGPNSPVSPVISSSNPSSAGPVNPPSTQRIHIVADGESLSRISLQYYGTASRWQEIYDANRDLLKGENTLHPGQRLRIP